ncbi:hypothetical protein SLA2020_277080 [Shorea laevis]
MAKKLVNYSVGNPAAVCLLEEERDEQWLQAVAAEFNISDTCYLTRLTESGPLDSSIPRFRLRWFTPVTEVKLCEGFFIELDFPTVPLTDFNPDEVSSISNAVNGAAVHDIKITTSSDDLFLVHPSTRSVVELQPDRFFCPKVGVNEDPVCGSAHCALAPYWSKKLGKCDFVANAASPRGGVVNIHLDEQNQRVLLRGKAVTVMQGSLLV